MYLNLTTTTLYLFNGLWNQSDEALKSVVTKVLDLHIAHKSKSLFMYSNATKEPSILFKNIKGY